MTYFNSHTEMSIVQFNYASHYNAVQKLVRPWEVEHLITRNVSPWVMARNPPLPEQVARYLREQFQSKQLSYKSDPPGFDVWYSPAVTLRRRAGDCEDFAILGVSMLTAVGISAEVAVGTYSNGYSSSGHAWVEGRDNHGGFLIEGTTGDIHRHYRPAEYTLMWSLTPNIGRRAA